MENLQQHDVEAIIAGDMNNRAARTYGYYPFHASGMSPPGPDYIAQALALGGEDEAVRNYHLNRMYLQTLYGTLSLPISMPGYREMVSTVPGHLWGGHPGGPVWLRNEDTPYDEQPPVIMVVGKMPGKEEVQAGRNLVGASGQHLRAALLELGINPAELDDWYIANLVRWPNIDPRGGALKPVWIKDCLPVLEQEYRLVRPNYILCLGAEATKAVCGPGHSLDNMIGRYVTVRTPIDMPGDEPEYHDMNVMAVTHPAGVLRQTEREPQYRATLKDFSKLIRGEEFAKRDKGIVYRYVYKLRDLREIVDGILQKEGLKQISVDAEWNGQHPGEPGSYLRSIQISCHDDYGINIVLRHQGGELAFRPGQQAAIKELKRLLDRDDVQIIGSFFAADMEWLTYYGLDLRERYLVPYDVKDLNHGDYPGGFDVAMGMHSVNETGELKLEIMATRFCGAARWDIDIIKWRKQYCSEHKLKEKDLPGYGDCPDEILLKYGTLDAVYTRRLKKQVQKMLDQDRHGNASWVPYHITMQALPAFCEMGMTGIKVDRERIDMLTDLYVEVREARLQELRDEVGWPTFNPRSQPQCVELLFGERYGKKDDIGDVRRLRPDGAVSLGLRPVKTTGQRGMPWERVIEKNEEHKHNPSTDKETCGILGMHNETAMKLRDIRLIDQILKSVLRPPQYHKDGTMKGTTTAAESFKASRG
jgi:DNA polymerase